METSLVKKANAFFCSGNFAEAKAMYKQLSQQFGEALFSANIKLCDLRLGGQSPVLLDVNSAQLENTNTDSVTFEQIKEQLRVTQSQLEYYFQQCQNLQLRLMDQNK